MSCRPKAKRVAADAFAPARMDEDDSAYFEPAPSEPFGGALLSSAAAPAPSLARGPPLAWGRPEPESDAVLDAREAVCDAPVADATAPATRFVPRACRQPPASARERGSQSHAAPADALGMTFL